MQLGELQSYYPWFQEKKVEIVALVVEPQKLFRLSFRQIFELHQQLGKALIGLVLVEPVGNLHLIVVQETGFNHSLSKTGIELIPFNGADFSLIQTEGVTEVVVPELQGARKSGKNKASQQYRLALAMK